MLVCVCVFVFNCIVVVCNFNYCWCNSERIWIWNEQSNDRLARFIWELIVSSFPSTGHNGSGQRWINSITTSLQKARSYICVCVFWKKKQGRAQNQRKQLKNVFLVIWFISHFIDIQLDSCNIARLEINMTREKKRRLQHQQQQHGQRQCH